MTTETLVTNDSELWNAIASDNTGEVVRLAPDTAFSAQVYKRSRPEGINTRIIGSSGSSLTIRLTETAGWTVEDVSQLYFIGKSSSRLNVIGCGASDSQKFVDVRNCAYVRIEDYIIDRVEFPVTLMAIQHAVVRNGTLRQWSKDGIRLSAAENVTISGVDASDPDAPNNGVFHPDVIQYFASPSIKLDWRSHGSCRDVLIEDVTLTTVGKSVQGIFFASPGDGWPPHERITIRNCLLSHGHPRGITLAGAIDSTIQDNVLHRNPDALSFHGEQTENHQPRIYLENFHGYLLNNIQINAEGEESAEAGVRRGENAVIRGETVADQLSQALAEVSRLTVENADLRAKIRAAIHALA